MTSHKILLLFCCLFAVHSCSGTRVTRSVDNQPTDLSGKWNETDSRLVSTHMVSDLLSDTWSKVFFNRKGRKPVIGLGKVLNKTTEHISTQTFIKDIELALQYSDAVELAATGKAKKEARKEREDQHEHNLHPAGTRIYQEKEVDFLLRGYIHSVEDQLKDVKTVYYQIDLELVSVATNDKVWNGQKRIKKIIEKPLLKW